MKETYTPFPMGVNATLRLSINAAQVAGFIAKTTGTISITDRRGVTVVDAVPVTAGVYLPMLLNLRGKTAGNAQEPTIVLAGGASGTLLC